jgi:hypothetical protein
LQLNIRRIPCDRIVDFCDLVSLRARQGSLAFDFFYSRSSASLGASNLLLKLGQRSTVRQVNFSEHATNTAACRRLDGVDSGRQNSAVVLQSTKLPTGQAIQCLL